MAVVQYQFDYETLSYDTLTVHYGKLDRGVMLLVYLQNTCKSPFIKEYVGAVSSGHLWLTLTILSKTITIDERESKEIKENYPKAGDDSKQ